MPNRAKVLSAPIVMIVVKVAGNDCGLGEEGSKMARDPARPAGEVEDSFRRLPPILDKGPKANIKRIRTLVPVVGHFPGGIEWVLRVFRIYGAVDSTKKILLV